MIKTYWQYLLSTPPHPPFFINSWWILFSGWQQYPVMVRNSSSAWLACCLLAEKSVYVRIFGKQQNVMLWSGRSYFVLFLQNLNFEVFTLSNMWPLLRKNNANFSGLFFLFVLFLYLWQCNNVSRMWHSMHTLGSGRLARGYNILRKFSGIPVFHFCFPT